MRSILSFLMVATLTSNVSAAPIQGLIDAQTGSVSFSGLTGEIFIAIRGPEQLLRPQNQIDPPWFPEPPIPGEISLLGLGGFSEV